MNTLQCAFRSSYGDAIADLVIAHLAPPEECAGGCGAGRARAELLTILADPAACDLRDLDALTRALLMEPAWRRWRVQALSGLAPEQRAECARYALDHLRPPKKSLGERELSMVLCLLRAARGWHAPRRIRLVRDALFLVFGADYARATAVIRKAHAALRPAIESRPIAGAQAGEIMLFPRDETFSAAAQRRRQGPAPR